MPGISTRNYLLLLIPVIGVIFLAAYAQDSMQDITGEAAKKPVTGSLLLDSRPQDAVIYLDGTMNGTTPRLFEKISVGYHKVLLAKQGYKNYSTNVYIYSGKLSKLNVTLAPLPNTTTNQTNQTNITIVFEADTAEMAASASNGGTGSLYVNSTPSGALLYFNASYVGMTPILLTRLAPSNYTIELVKTGYYDYRAVVRIQAQKRTKVYVLMQSKNATY